METIFEKCYDTVLYVYDLSVGRYQVHCEYCGKKYYPASYHDNNVYLCSEGCFIDYMKAHKK